MERIFRSISLAIAVTFMFAINGSVATTSVAPEQGLTRVVVIGNDLGAVSEAVIAAGAPVIAQLQHLRGIESRLNHEQLEHIARSTAVTRIVNFPQRSSGVEVAGMWWLDSEVPTNTYANTGGLGNWWDVASVPTAPVSTLLAGMWWLDSEVSTNTDANTGGLGNWWDVASVPTTPVSTLLAGMWWLDSELPANADANVGSLGNWWDVA